MTHPGEVTKRLTDRTFDITALGEALIDFTEAGHTPGGMRLFEQNPGGAPANLLCAAARFGAKTAFIGKVGLDMHGRLLKATLSNEGVNTRGMVEAEDVFTTLAFVALRNGEREFSFSRKPGADTRLTKDEVDFSVLENSAVFHFGSLSLTDEPSRSATYAAIDRAKTVGAIVSYDPNYRPALWSCGEEAVTQMRGPLPSVDMIKLSEEEAALLSGYLDPKRAIKEIGREINLVAVTLGSAGALVYCGGEIQTVPAYEVTAVDTTGAGDSFWGGFLYKLLESGKTPDMVTIEEAVSFARFGNAAAAICVSRRGGIPSMPKLKEAEALMKSGGYFL